MIFMTRCFKDRQVLKQEDRILDGIDIEGELNSLRMVVCIPVT